MEDLSDRCLNLTGPWICTLPLGHAGDHGGDLHRDRIIAGEQSYRLDAEAVRRVIAAQ